MVTPEGAAGRGQRPPKPRRTLGFAAAALVLAVGAVAFGALTPPDPELAAVDNTTTTTVTTSAPIDRPVDMDDFSVGEIARGEPLDWQQSELAADGFPIALVDHGGWLYLFAAPAAPFTGLASDGGLLAWRSGDGIDWEPLGEVIDSQHRVISVTATSRGLMAAETGTTEPGLRLWRSSDGIEWEPIEVPLDGLQDHTVVYPGGVGASENALVVFTQRQLGAYELVQTRLADHLGQALDPRRYGWDIQILADELTFTIWGPLGIPMGEVTASELGLSETEQELVIDSQTGGDPLPVEVFTFMEETGWQRSEIPNAYWVESLTTLPDGSFMATGSSQSSQAVWTSIDGLEWEEPTRSVFTPRGLQVWRDGLVGPSQLNQASISFSRDGLEWEEIGPVELFPRPIMWDVGAFDAGDAGLAATVLGWGPGQVTPPTEPVTLVDGDTKLTVDFQQGQIQLDSSGETYRYRMWENTDPEGVEADMSRSVIVFTDPETQETLAEFDIDELMRVETDYWDSTSPEEAFAAFIFSPDGETWTIEDAGTRFGSDYWAQRLLIGESSIVMVTQEGTSRFDPSLPPRFEIWAAPLP